MKPTNLSQPIPPHQCVTVAPYVNGLFIATSGKLSMVAPTRKEARKALTLALAL